MQIDNGVLLFGNKESTVENIEQSKNEIIDFLINQKRHQIKISPKFETDNTKTNLKSNSADYLKYLVDNNILSTNAVVNEPTFQGYTNIYLNTGITVSNQTKPVKTNNVQTEIEAKKAEIERRRQELNKNGRTDFNQGFITNNTNVFLANIGSQTLISSYPFDTFEKAFEFLSGYKNILDKDDYADEIRYGKEAVQSKKAEQQKNKNLEEIERVKKEKDRALKNILFEPSIGEFVTLGNIRGKTKQEVEDKINAKYNAKLKALEQPTSTIQSEVDTKKTIQKIPREDISFFVSGGTGVGHQSFPSNKSTSDYDIRSNVTKLSGFRYVEHSDGTISFHIPYNGLDIRGGSHLGIAIKGLKLEQIDEKSVKEAINKLGDALSKISKNITHDERKNEIERIGNDVINTELKALEQPIVSDAGVKVKTEGTGFENLFGNISTVTQPVTGTSISYTPTGKQTQTYTIDKTRILNSNGKEVFKEDSADRRKIFANLAIKEGRAKVIEDDKGVKYVVDNKQQIISTITGKIMAWAENHPTRLLLNSKYNNLINPKVSDAGVQVTTTNTGFEDLFKNKPNNTRNSQENFVSLSEIPGTPQNTEVKETQKEVFETVKVVNPATEQRLINSLIKKYQEDKLVSERDIAKFEAWKQSNPEQWKKICK
jgi:hypothetical protein